MTMNQRLCCIYDLVRPGRGVVDVGTDHGYLPERLALAGYMGNIYASDLRSGPLSAAMRTAERSGVFSKIRFVLCDGLAAIPPDEVDTIVVAGMGGDTICGILDRADWCMNERYRLLLQPMTKAEILRYWLSCNGFSIEEERLVAEGDTIYQILAARFTGQNEALSDLELFLGKKGCGADEELYRALLAQRISSLERRIAGLRLAADTPERQSELKRLLHALEETEREAGHGDYNS